MTTASSTFAMRSTSAAAAELVECAPAQIKGDPSALPPAWREALEALVAATASEGQPWSCTNARVAILPPTPEHPALLEVEDAAGVRRRAVARPRDVVSLGEAMLATIPGDERPSSEPPTTAPLLPGLPVLPGEARLRVVDPTRLEGVPPTADSTDGTSLLFDALLGVRYTGPTRSLLVGPELRATYAFDRWAGGILARYDTAADVFQRVPNQFTLTSITIGLHGGYRMLAKPFELTASVEPTLAASLLGAQRPGQPPDAASHVDLRLGARLAGAFPLSSRMRAVFALGAEGAPAALGSSRFFHHEVLPGAPTYLAGASLGLQMKANP